MLCPRCGNEIASPETQAFCPVCGLSLLSPSPAAPATSPAGSPPEPPVGFQAEGQSFLYSPSPLDAQQDPQAPLPEEPVPTPYAAPSFEAAAVVPAVAAKAPKKKMGTGRKVLLGILGGILALALAFVAVSVILENNRSKNFNQAIELMDAGQYHDALEKFRSLGDYESAESLAAQCEDFIEYEEAKRLMDAGDYQKALSMFSGLSGFEDSKALATLCQNNLDYQQGTTLFNAGKYADALTYFEPLAREDFLDAKEMVSQSEYALAENL
ncbi:MAG: hypothetical protein LBB46_02945, partial [Coriobacteriaceae bacterium]|nr:hypothetical protein [Coriobacteriaceae bacterium]